MREPTTPRTPAPWPTEMYDWQVDGAGPCGTHTDPAVATGNLAEAIARSGAEAGEVRERKVMTEAEPALYARVRVDPVTSTVIVERSRG